MRAVKKKKDQKRKNKGAACWLGASLHIRAHLQNCGHAAMGKAQQPKPRKNQNQTIESNEVSSVSGSSGSLKLLPQCFLLKIIFSSGVHLNVEALQEKKRKEKNEKRKLRKTHQIP